MWWSACASGAEVGGLGAGIGDERLAEDDLELVRYLGRDVRGAAHAWPDAARGEQLVEDRADGEDAGARVAFGALALLGREASAVARVRRRYVRALLDDVGAAALRRVTEGGGVNEERLALGVKPGELGAERTTIPRAS